MATSIAARLTRQRVLNADRNDVLGLVLSAALPLAVFVIANGIAEMNGALPLFFSPFGLPGWVGGALHIGSLPLFGIARWMVAREGRQGRVAGWWLVALMAGTIAFPFVVTPLDSLMLSIVAMLLLLVGLGAAARTGEVSPRAAWIMLPGLAWMGFSAFIGLSFVASWSPPFGIANGSQSS
ncbi:tryptophan-rich sensory protein [Devosia lacusdianchii]|uniref:tryptophan-rich sensory protein n=1 Tax=Devosia lacusdianchii TaxID=2917991 RepID=UPI001F05AFCA|nr:tryptophan-rich sensory protein [Devosia sp. JXJ CY 41]